MVAPPRRRARRAARRPPRRRRGGRRRPGWPGSGRPGTGTGCPCRPAPAARPVAGAAQLRSSCPSVSGVGDRDEGAAGVLLADLGRASGRAGGTGRTGAWVSGLTTCPPARARDRAQRQALGVDQLDRAGAVAAPALGGQRQRDRAAGLVERVEGRQRPAGQQLEVVELPRAWGSAAGRGTTGGTGQWCHLLRAPLPPCSSGALGACGDA